MLWLIGVLILLNIILSFLALAAAGAVLKVLRAQSEAIGSVAHDIEDLSDILPNHLAAVEERKADV